MANCCYKGKEVRSRSDRDREVKLSSAHTVTLINTDINFRVTDSVAIKWQSLSFGLSMLMLILLKHFMLIELMWCLPDNKWFGGQ